MTHTSIERLSKAYDDYCLENYNHLGDDYAHRCIANLGSLRIYSATDMARDTNGNFWYKQGNRQGWEMDAYIDVKASEVVLEIEKGKHDMRVPIAGSIVSYLYWSAPDTFHHLLTQFLGSLLKDGALEDAIMLA